MNRRTEAIAHAADAVFADSNGLATSAAIRFARAAITAYEAHMRPEITSTKEAEALPSGTIIQDQGDVLEKFAFEDGTTYWNHFGADSPSRTSDLVFPARVIHWGDSE